MVLSSPDRLVGIRNYVCKQEKGGNVFVVVHVKAPFAKLRKAINSFVMAVYWFAWKNSAPKGRIFMKFYM